MTSAIATIGVTIIVGLFFLFIVLRLVFATGGRPGGTDSTNFPYDNSWNSIPPPSWSPDSGSNSDNNNACEVSDSGGWSWSDSGSDSGSCDSGGDSGGGDGGGGGGD